jgi:hypothetical protein
LKRCASEGVDELGHTQILQKGPKKLRTREALEKALHELVQLGRVQALRDGNRKTIRVHPALLHADKAKAKWANQANDPRLPGDNLSPISPISISPGAAALADDLAWSEA